MVNMKIARKIARMYGCEFSKIWYIVPVVPHKAVAEVSKIGNL